MTEKNRFIHVNKIVSEKILSYSIVHPQPSPSPSSPLPPPITIFAWFWRGYFSLSTSTHTHTPTHIQSDRPTIYLSKHVSIPSPFYIYTFVFLLIGETCAIYYAILFDIWRFFQLNMVWLLPFQLYLTIPLSHLFLLKLSFYPRFKPELHDKYLYMVIQMLNLTNNTVTSFDFKTCFNIQIL